MFFLVNPRGQMDQNTFPFDMCLHKVKSTAQKINELLHMVLTLTLSSGVERGFSSVIFSRTTTAPRLWILHFDLLKGTEPNL